jgi:hypothetical protein
VTNGMGKVAHRGVTMELPSKLDFLMEFGLDPVEEDPSMALYRYVKQSDDGLQELAVSFGGVCRSFQVILRCGGNELMSMTSESVEHIKIRRDKSGAGSLHVLFDLQGTISEALVTLEPELRCDWWILRA